MSVTDTLYRAADIIEEKGYCSTAYECEDGSIDIIEAIFQAATGISQSYYWECRNNNVMPITLNDHNKWRWAVITFRNWLKARGEEDQPALWGDHQTQEHIVECLRTCAEADRKS
jgi:hypothetical protein